MEVAHLVQSSILNNDATKDTRDSRADMGHADCTEIRRRSNLSPEKIAERAYELWLQRDCISGFDVENWCDAERGLLQEERDQRGKV